MLEDPRLSSDPDTGRNEKVVMWSYPVIKDGLIYVIDLRNGLYVLEYEGRFEREVKKIDFLEGNSNQGDALCFEPVGTAPSYCTRLMTTPERPGPLSHLGGLQPAGGALCPPRSPPAAAGGDLAERGGPSYLARSNHATRASRSVPATPLSQPRSKAVKRSLAASTAFTATV